LAPVSCCSRSRCFSSQASSWPQWPVSR
jgi:hypothetical protein